MLRGLGMTDVGTGGVDGFDWEADALTKFEVRYHPGGHSRALLPENLPSLARFVTTGDRTLPEDLVERRPGWFSTLVNAAPWLGQLWRSAWWQEGSPSCWPVRSRCWATWRWRSGSRPSC